MSCSPETLKKLAKFDTPTICNAIELFDICPPHAGFMDGRIQARFPEMPPMVGFASTAAFRSAAPPATGNAYGTVVDQVERFGELPGPAVMVFQDLDDPPVGATFGEVMCSTYKAFGSVGLVTSGGARDLDQVRALGYPVFSSCAICAHAHCHILHLGLPVRVGGLMVKHGDLLHGDANGVANVPLEIADAVPDAAQELVAMERIILDYVQRPEPKTLPRYREVHREAIAVYQQLRARLSRKPRG